MLSWKISQLVCTRKIGSLTPDLPVNEFIRRWQCHTACVMKKLGTMTEHGKYDVEYVIKGIATPDVNSDRIISQLRNCAQRSVGRDDCETASLISDCISKIRVRDGWQLTVNSHKFMFGVDLI